MDCVACVGCEWAKLEREGGNGGGCGPGRDDPVSVCPSHDGGEERMRVVQRMSFAWCGAVACGSDGVGLWLVGQMTWTK